MNACSSGFRLRLRLVAVALIMTVGLLFVLFVGAGALKAHAIEEVQDVPIFDLSWYAILEQEGETQRLIELVWADVDSNGRPDLSVLLKDQVWVFVNRNAKLEADASVKQLLRYDKARAHIWAEVDGQPGPDLIVLQEGGTIEIHDNSSVISAQNSQSLQTTSPPTSGDTHMSWGDFDGDQDLDLAVSNERSLRIISNDGGVFDKIVSSKATAGTALALAWGDADGDGDLDLAVGNPTGGLQLYPNQDGRIRFDVSRTLDRDTPSEAIIWADVDRDGDLDIITAFDEKGTVSHEFGSWTTLDPAIHLYKNQGDNFSRRELLRPRADQTRILNKVLSLHWADYDNDGDPELFRSGSSSSEVFEYDSEQIIESQVPSLPPASLSRGDFPDLPALLGIGDADGDGDLDLAISVRGLLRVYVNEGSPYRLSQQTEKRDYNWGGLAWGDMDKDGDFDLAAGYQDDPSSIYLNEGGILREIPWGEPVGKVWAMKWGDIDGLGSLELAVVHEDSSRVITGYTRQALFDIYQYQGGTLRRFQSLQPQDFGDRVPTVHWADLEEDGDLDLLVGAGGTLSGVYCNLSGSSIDSTYHPLPNSVTESISLEEINRLDDLGAILKGTCGQGFSLGWGTTHKTITSSLSTLPPVTIRHGGGIAGTWGDLDGDGLKEVALAGPAATIHRRFPANVETAPIWSSELFDLAIPSWIDFDRDADLDLVLVASAALDSGEYELPFYRNDNGLMTQDPSSALSDGDYLTSLAWSDADGDGDADLAVGGSSVRLYRYEKAANPVWMGQQTGIQIHTQDLAPPEILAAPVIQAISLPITYTLYHPGGRPMRQVKGYYSLDGGGRWQPAVSTTDTVTSSLGTLSVRRYYRHEPVLMPSGESRGDSSPVTSALLVSTTESIVDLDVWLSVIGDFPDGLAVEIESPAGTVVRLFEGAVDSIGTLMDVAFDDQGVCESSSGNIGRCYRPIAPLGVLDGESLAGVWKLRISNASLRSGGEIRGWGISSANSTPLHVHSSTPVVLDMAAGRGITSSVNVTSTAERITDVDVTLTLDHSATDELVINLESPSGTVVPLVKNLKRSFDGFTRLRLSDQAVNDLDSGEARYTGAYRPLGRLSSFDNENPSGTWILHLANAAHDRGTGTLHSWSLSLQTAGGATHVYHWDVVNSGFFGKSDHVVFRLVAYPDEQVAPNGTPDPYVQNSVAAHTNPFSVRGSQVRVMNAAGPSGDAVVYQLPKGQTQGAAPIGAAGRSFRTAPTGFLPGRGELELGDRLVALTPTDVISAHTPTRLYFSQDSLLPLTITGTQTQTLLLVITDTRRLADIDVLLDISHTAGSDLSATLIAPDGLETTLVTTTRLLGNHLVAVRLDQQAALPLSRETATAAARPAALLEPLVGRPLDGAWTLRLANRGQGASSIVNGWGLALQVSDLFYTSAPLKPDAVSANGSAPTELSLEMATMTAGGVQTLTVSPANPLLVFDLDVALEWDARNDAKYLAQLEFDLQRASEFLYDWTNGQVALGRITVYHDAKRNVFPGQGDPWSEADVRIYATNRIRPNAAQGGIVSEPFTDTVQGPGADAPNVYGPGQVAMGAVWNRFGDASGNLGEDWSRTLAHELGHYLLFLDDNYLGMDDGLLVTVDGCPGAMADHYSDDYDTGYGEFNTAPSDEKAQAACSKTLSKQRTARSDWETITTFYPALRSPEPGVGAEGPANLPLDLTQVQFVSPVTQTNALVAPVIRLTFDDRAATQTSNARVFLFKAGDQWIVDLGRPKLDQVVAYGAEPGDRLATFDLALRRTGSKIIQPTTQERSLEREPDDWQPRVSIRPAGKGAIEVRVANVTSERLRARLYPQDFPAGPAMDLQPVSREGEYAAIFTMTVPAYTGFVHVWDDAASTGVREIVTDYALGGWPTFAQDPATAASALSPELAKMRANSLAKMRGSSIAKMRASSLAKMRASSIAKMRASSLGKIRAYAAAMSSDGQVLLFGDDLKFKEGEFVTLQAATLPPSIPAWATLVGQAYEIAVSTPTIPITNASLSFGYLGGDVPAGQEEGLRIHFWNGNIWQELETRLDTDNNYASARLQGPGLYALLTSVEVPLRPGWNLIGYPVLTSSVPVDSRRIDDVLRDIDGQYAAIYGYDACDSTDPWKLYSPAAPGRIGDLAAPEFGHGYWINITAAEPITLHLRGGFATDDLAKPPPASTPACARTQPSVALPAPPTTYYGGIRGAEGFSPTAGQAIVAKVDGVVCGTAVTTEDGSGVVYDIAVEAASPEKACGSAGKVVTFYVDNLPVGSRRWTGSGLEALDLQPGRRPASGELQSPACTRLLPNGDFELGLSWDASPPDGVTLAAGEGRENTQGLRISTEPSRKVTLERELELPAGAGRLSLSFAFKRADDVQSGPDLSVLVNGQPKWQQRSGNTVWRDASIDLTSNRGQRVRLKLEAWGWQPRQSSAVILDTLEVFACQ